MAALSNGKRSLLAGFAVLVAAVLLYALVLVLFGDGGRLFDSSQPLGLDPSAQANLVFALLLAFTYGAGAFEKNAISADLRELRPLLRPSGSKLIAASKDTRGFRRSAIRRAAVPGALIGAALRLLPNASIRDGIDATQLILMVLLFAMLAVRAFESLTSSRLLSELGRSHTTVRLFESGPIHVFGRVGFRLSSNWFIGSAIASMLFIGMANPIIVTMVLVVTYGLGALTLVLPALGIHENLRKTRRRELVRAREAIEAEGAALFAEAGASNGSRLPALIAYEARVEAVHEWPFDAPMLLRFSLLALVATGSWVAGAVVERLLGLALE